MLLAVLILAALQLPLSPPSAETATNCAQLTDMLMDRATRSERFDLTATLIETPTMNTLGLVDASGATSIAFPLGLDRSPLRAGDRLRIRGVIYRKPGEPTIAEGLSLDRISRGDPPKRQLATSRELLLRALEFQPVRFIGTVEDVLEDEIDPRFALLVLRDEFGSLYGSIHLDGESLPSLRELIGARIDARGVCNPGKLFNRRKLGTNVNVRSFEVIEAAPKDPFAAPRLDEDAHLAPYELEFVGRRRVAGRVLAVWKDASILLRTGPDSIIRIDLADGGLPACGDAVEAVGHPETDLYRFNLSRAIWRKTTSVPDFAEPEPLALTARQILFDESGRLQIKNQLHGRPLRLTGTVRSLPDSDGRDRRLILEDGTTRVPVDASALPGAFDGIEPGCRVSVTGTCVMDVDNWRPNAALPQIRGFFLVVRTPDDIVILARPSWWTARRLAGAAGILLALLVGFSVWGILLRRAVSRKSRELEHAIIARVGADFRVHERTRLAVELHDSLSQTLTGVAMEIRSAVRAPDGDSRKAAHLTLAEKAVDACREELKDCLWDLRNNALDEADMNEAIRRTAAPHLGDAELVIRFNVPRTRFTDNTAHAILRIIRELAGNAVRHGHAKSIHVAGAIEGDKLLFSVRDDGAGFDPAHAPGPEEGHFGLQGIRERIDAFNGEMSVESTPGRGTRVSIALHVPQETDARQ